MHKKNWCKSDLPFPPILCSFLFCSVHFKAGCVLASTHLQNDGTVFLSHCVASSITFLPTHICILMNCVGLNSSDIFTCLWWLSLVVKFVSAMHSGWAEGCYLRRKIRDRLWPLQFCLCTYSQALCLCSVDINYIGWVGRRGRRSFKIKPGKQDLGVHRSANVTRQVWGLGLILSAENCIWGSGIKQDLSALQQHCSMGLFCSTAAQL